MLARAWCPTSSGHIQWPRSLSMTKFGRLVPLSAMLPPIHPLLNFWRSGPASVQASCRTIRHGMNTCPTQLPVRLGIGGSTSEPGSERLHSLRLHLLVLPRPGRRLARLLQTCHVSCFRFILKPRFGRWLREQQHVHAIVTPSPFMLYPITKQPALLGNLHRRILIP